VDCGVLAKERASSALISKESMSLGSLSPIKLALVIGACAALPTEDLRSRRNLLSFSQQFCYVHANGTLQSGAAWIPDDCTDEPVSAPACTIASSPGPGNLCKLTTSSRGVDSGRWDDYDFASCSKSFLYVRGENTECDAEGTDCQYYCEKLELTGDWSTRQRTGRADVTTRCGWFGCSWFTCGWGSGYEWHDGQCRDKTRYLGEDCWDDSGECSNDGVEPYDGLRMACATDEPSGVTTPRCIPSAFRLDNRNQCTCNWFDWHLGVACGADQCNGHACVWSTGGGWACDYQTDNNW